MPLNNSYIAIIRSKNTSPIAINDDSLSTYVGIPLDITPLDNDFDFNIGDQLSILTFDSTTSNSGTILRVSNGLKGEYYSYTTNNNFSTLLLTRVDNTINFAWGSGRPDPAVPTDNFSVRWTGILIPKYTETYTFRVISDDGVRLWVNNILIIDKWLDQPPKTYTGTVNLTLNVPVNIKLEYYEKIGGATISLAWRSPTMNSDNGLNSTDFTIIPQEELYHIDNSTNNLLYIPPLNFFGSDTFSYNITDGGLVSNTAQISIDVNCKYPIISPKTFTLKPSTTYTLDITNINSSPDIVFSDGKPDRDSNTPKQDISIISSSVSASTDIDILQITTTTIRFSTTPLPAGASARIGSYIVYDIINSLCGTKTSNDPNNESVVGGGGGEGEGGGGGGGGEGGGGVIISGTTQSTGTRVVAGFLGQVTVEGNVPLTFTKYPQLEQKTNQYPWEQSGWYLFVMDTYNVEDQFYITQISKPYTDINTGLFTQDKYYNGLIGPVGDNSNEGNCVFIFWHPENTNLDIWGVSQTNGSGYSFGCVRAFKPSITNEFDSNRYFLDPNIKPTSTEVKACLSTLNSPYKDYKVDITNNYTGTNRPSFIAP